MIVRSLSPARRASLAITETVVTAVSDADDCDPLSLPPLWDVIDPEALDQLFAPTRGGRPRAGRVTFGYAGYEVSVEVSADATVAVSLETAEKTLEF